ncbi:MAG: hypothetical protein JNL90_14770 [Planctomycetes bacterium]|nr:hypothetical protein [Planctomycetota bacterium]
MTSARLREQLERELPLLHVRGERELVAAFLELDHGGDFARLESYLDGCRRVARQATERGATWLAAVLRYFVGRTLAFPLDRPQEALPIVVELLAELQSGPQRGSVLAALVELELLRACHKSDAPGHRALLVAGGRELMPRLRDDLGPCTELLDVLWRTGWWCRDVALMKEARRMAEAHPQALRFSAGYWQARERSLEGAHADGVALLRGLLADREELDRAGDSWRHYLEVELARQEVVIGAATAAAARLARIGAEVGPVRDPMLAWERAIAAAALAAARGDVDGEVAQWGAALDAVEGLGTERLEAEFALALGEAAARAGREPPFARARARLAERLPVLLSRADLEARARALPGLYS